MGVKKLDLEFEDRHEEELRKKKQLSEERKRNRPVDIQFSADKKHTPPSPSPTPSPAPAAAPAAAVAASNREAGRSLLDNTDELRKLVKASKVLDEEMEAKTKAALIEAETKMIALYAQETKLLEYKILQIVKDIYAKAPAVKGELLQIKELLKTHAEIRSHNTKL